MGDVRRKLLDYEVELRKEVRYRNLHALQEEELAYREINRVGWDNLGRQKAVMAGNILDLEALLRGLADISPAELSIPHSTHFYTHLDLTHTSASLLTTSEKHLQTGEIMYKHTELGV